MNLNDYCKKIGNRIPHLSPFYKEYSKIFKEYYKWASQNIKFFEHNESKKTFICLMDENDEFKKRVENNEYLIDEFERDATKEEIFEMTGHFSKGFEDGFNDVEFIPYLTRNIIDNIVFQSPFEHQLFGRGILRTKGYANDIDKYLLMPNQTAYKEGYYEGKRFKSYFLYIEFYDQFKGVPEPFLRPLEYFESESIKTFIHFTDLKDFDFKKVQNIEATDNRLNVRQSKDELIKLFNDLLKDWYSQKDIEYFLKANFKCFEEKEKPRILHSIAENKKGLQVYLYRITYDFFRAQKYKGEKRIRFAEMLQNNFDVFKKSNLNTIDTNLPRNRD